MTRIIKTLSKGGLMVPEDVAAKFRDDHGYVGRGGVVVVFDGVAGSWVDRLRNPEHWRVGAIAVDESGNVWDAVGAPGSGETAVAWVRRPRPGRRGRPPTGNAMSDSERSRLKRERAKQNGKDQISVTLSFDVIEAIRKHVEFKDLTLGDAVEKALRDRFLRKR